MRNIHFKTALDYIKRSPFQALAAIFVLALTFSIGTMLTVLIYSSSNLLKYFETRPQVIAFLKDNITPEQISALQNKLLNDLRVKEVRYVPKEEALSIYKEATKNNPLLSELVSPSIFPASLEFSVVNLSFAPDIVSEVKKEGIVSEVGFTASVGGENTMQDALSRLRTLSIYLRVGGAIFIAVLTSTSFLVLVVIISMRLSSRKTEVEILDLIGATPGFIRSPIFLETFIYSFAGVFAGWLSALLVWLYLAPNIISYFGEIPVLPKDTLGFMGLFLVILLAELIIGTSLAVLGSLLALSRARRSR